MAKRKKQATTKPAPTTVKFLLMVQTWLRVRWASEKEGLYLVAKSIERYTKGFEPTDTVEIAVPIDMLDKLARACANYGQLGVGRGFAVAASSHAVESKPPKTVDAGVMKEAVQNAADELSEMEKC